MKWPVQASCNRFTCVGAEVSFEVWALGVGLGATRVFTAVSGRPFFPCRPAPTLPLQTTRGQLWSNQQRLLVEGQVTRGLAVGIVTEKASVVVKVWHVAVVSRVSAHSLRWYEPAVGKGHHGRVLKGIVRSKVTWWHFTEVSSTVSVQAACLGEAKLICVRKNRKQSQTCLVINITMVIQFRLDRGHCGFRRGQEIHHQAPTVHVQMLLSCLVLKHGCLLVRAVWV